MKHHTILFAVAGLSLATALFAQSSSQSSSTSRSGNGQASGYSSASGSASGSSRAGGSQSGSGFGSGSGSGSGIVGKPTHAIMYTLDSDASAETARRLMGAHLKYLGELQGKGVIFFGPWRDHPGSMAVVMVRTDDQALAIARNDPAVKAGGMDFEVRAWNVITTSTAR